MNDITMPNFKEYALGLTFNKDPKAIEKALKNMWELGYRYAVANDWWSVQEGDLESTQRTPYGDRLKFYPHGTMCACDICCGDPK